MPLQPKLIVENAQKMKIKKVELDEMNFRWLMNEDPMATMKLSEGIRNFSNDLHKLELFVSELF